jgi:hypothetical protein
MLIFLILYVIGALSTLGWVYRTYPDLRDMTAGEISVISGLWWVVVPVLLYDRYYPKEPDL